ncbi:MAG: nucleotidyltransferase family protein [Desulfarculus sp.]|nr:nucleotidyltransferase family protein [Desulfarculus sp.]
MPPAKQALHGIGIPRQNLAEFCRRHGIGRLGFFGSVLREDFRPESDLDVLIEFLPGRGAGYLQMAAMEQELSRLLGRKVDLRTPAELSRHFREEVVEASEVQYFQEMNC